MSRPIAYAALFLVLSGVATAQVPSRVEQERSERLGVYLRTGRYADARRLIDEFGPRDDLKAIRALLGSAPNMKVGRKSAVFPCDVTDTGVSLPLTVNGMRVNWLADTGAAFSVISDAEARSLGLAIRDSQGRLSDLAGGAIGVRNAVARQLAIGGTRLKNVLFLVLPADQMPWKEVPAGRQGIVGLPALIALDSLGWNRYGTCRTGVQAPNDPSKRDMPNLTYQQDKVITDAEFDGKTLKFVLDTGNQHGTQLWDHFGKDFAALVKARGRPGSTRVTQIGGANDFETTIIPDVHLLVGGKAATLSQVQLFSRPVGDDRFDGLLGMDVLSQATNVTIDFRSMRLVLN